jgi:hypothetical protein
VPCKQNRRKYYEHNVNYFSLLSSSEINKGDREPKANSTSSRASRMRNPPYPTFPWSAQGTASSRWRGLPCFACPCHQLSTTRKTLICGASIWASVAHLWCATHIKPLIFITRGARPRAPRFSVLSVEHLEGVRHA